MNSSQIPLLVWRDLIRSYLYLEIGALADLAEVT
jgi:hypothetical protein